VPTCSGVVPRRIEEHIKNEGGLGGTTLLAYFGGPPYGYVNTVVKACVAGLLRAGKVKVQPESGAEITAMRDAGVRDLFEKDRAFNRATIFPGGEDDIGVPARARICKFFQEQLQHSMDREDHAIASSRATRSRPRPPRKAIKRRDGFATLTADQSHHVLRPIAEAVIATDDAAISPSLDQLRDGFERALAIAEKGRRRPPRRTAQ
jgi:hypothetical protein